MRIIITKHAKERMDRYNIQEELVKSTVMGPDEVVEGYGGTLIAHKPLNEHLLRVVYTKQDDEAKVVTVYPSKKARYWRQK